MTHSKFLRHAPEINSRFLKHRSSVCYKSDAPDADELLEKIKSTVSKELSTRATKDELIEINKDLVKLRELPIDELRSMADADKGVMKVLATQGLALQRLQDEIKTQPQDMSVRAQIGRWMETNKEAIKSIKDGYKRELPALDLRAAVANPMLPTTVAPGGTQFITRYEQQAAPNDYLRLQPVFWDYIRKGTTSAETYIWVNRKNPDGAAAWLLPGVYKPNISFTVDTEVSHAKKIAASEKMATELLQDIDGFASWVEDALRFKVMEKANATLMTGVASTTVPAGIQTLASTFAGAGLGIRTVNPNNYDAIRGAVAQLRAAKFTGPVTAFINPIDNANMQMTKAISQGQLFIAPATGATIVEDPNMAQGHILVTCLDYYKVLIYKPFTITWGWENDDFTKNLVTVIGEMRLHQYVSENYLGFAIYDTFANIITGITQA